MTPIDWTLATAAVVANLTAFSLMGIDKWKARRGAWRIPEHTLLLWCALFGALGGWFGMRTFRHKTQHRKFTIGVPALLVAQVALLALYVFRWR